MADLQEQIDDLVRQLKASRGDIGDLQSRADVSEQRAHVSEERADALSDRTDSLEKQSEIDGEMIAELQRDGVVSQEHAAQMEAALKSSRVVGAAIGIVMNSRQVSEFEAFGILKKASQDANRKLRDLAAEIVGSVEVR